MAQAKTAKSVFNVPDVSRVPVFVEARSEFEARVWAANKAMPGYRPLCQLRRNLIHLGTIHAACGRCFVHCRCEARP